MIKYNLCLIRRGTKILLLNREFPTWLGCWNGVGGKLEENEQPRDSVIREVYEETQINSPDLQFKGLITWSTPEGSDFGGMYLYLADIPEDYHYQTPLKTDEGILDWKEIDWILHPENRGMASNIPTCLEKVLYDEQCFNHHSIFADGQMVEQISTVIDSEIESDKNLRKEYLRTYSRRHTLT
ncbi:DNA mismatch repair protein MutT [Virgibacillus phasianinus]|uniref:DNA mismatch repair protein MutT n=1 Tax=Virgibacillus phasianinus TaxID=2017483 RepID=A0A220U6V1_9BACI|nr:8-oxo-dGTP diphosphatase [Virgibacillus phasianinus]ASK63820.1 DNA mismatch repair protein MutT [Virgibacillus phasianinus]